jgi:hypothetical protein
VPGLRNDPVAAEAAPTPEGADLIRWKYAFRELRPRKKNEPPHPTVITTRDGRYCVSLTLPVSLPHTLSLCLSLSLSLPRPLTPSDRTRLANPLEELSRSWSKRPRGLSGLQGQERMQEYADPDRDDERAKAISHADRLRRESLLRQNGLLKMKK